jgi:hypothetical protein
MSIIIITLNPSEILKQTRDTKRISNLKSINNALSIFQATKPTTSTGTANIVYISIPDSSSTCTNLSLPTLPTGYTYQCSTSTNYKKTDGTGWIPVNFDSLDIGSPLSSLPIDPTNTTSTNLFYTYTTGGSWELNAILESSKQKLSGGDDKTSVDGGDSYSTYEIGTDLSLSPYKDTGLVAYWRMDEGTGTTTKDDAASNTGTITGATWKPEGDCVSGNCLYFDGDDYVTTPAFALSGTVLTVTGWIKSDNDSNEMYQSLLSDNVQSSTVGYIAFFRRAAGVHYLYWKYADGTNMKDAIMYTFFTGYNNTWVHFTIVSDYSGATLKWYRNGVLIQTTAMTGTPIFPSTNRIRYIGGSSAGSGITNGNLDDIRIYNRGLSDAEIKSLYEGTK